MNRAVPLLVAALATAGCGGPDRPLELGFKEVPSNVVLGAQSSPTPAPGRSAGGPPAALLPLPPSVLTLPPPPFEVPAPGRTEPQLVPQPTAAPCGVADPRDAPALEAPSSIALRPAQGQYVFRNTGTYEISGANAQKGRFPALSLRTVSAALEGENGFLFDVTESGLTTVTTSYAVVERQPLPTDLAPGIYLVKRVTRGSDGQASTFTPKPELPLARFPLVQGARLEARGVDPLTQAAMTYTATVLGKDRVDACGENLDSWTLQLSEGRLLTANEDFSFDITYALGTQFGGLPLQEKAAWAGTSNGDGVSRTNTSTISSEPRSAPGPQP